MVTAATLPDAIETAIALAEESGDEGEGFGGSGMVITGSVVTAGAARTLFGKDPGMTDRPGAAGNAAGRRTRGRASAA